MLRFFTPAKLSLLVYRINSIPKKMNDNKNVNSLVMMEFDDFYVRI